MGKRKGRRGRKPIKPQNVQSGGGGLGGLDQLQGLQEKMLEAQDEIAEMTVTATAGGGAVEVVVNGEKHIESLTITPEVVDPEGIEMLQDLITAAINKGMEQIDEAATERMSGLTSGLGIQDLL